MNKNFRHNIVVGFIMLYTFYSIAQNNFSLSNNVKKQTVSFKLLNNLIVF
ncbi:hypothetical protein MNBD_BACTEROID04-1166, partial [hydrothermal vent metagenome]